MSNAWPIVPLGDVLEIHNTSVPSKELSEINMDRASRVLISQTSGR